MQICNSLYAEWESMPIFYYIAVLVNILRPCSRLALTCQDGWCDNKCSALSTCSLSDHLWSKLTFFLYMQINRYVISICKDHNWQEACTFPCLVYWKWKEIKTLVLNFSFNMMHWVCTSAYAEDVRWIDTHWTYINLHIITYIECGQSDRISMHLNPLLTPVLELTTHDLITQDAC